MGCLFLAIALTVAAPPGDADERGARAAVAAFHEVRARGVGQLTLGRLAELAAHDHPVVADLILDIFENATLPVAFPTARRVLAGFRSRAALAHILDEGLGHRDGGVRAQVLLALGEGRPATLDWRGAAETALDDEDARVRAAAVRIAGRGRLVSTLDRVFALATDPSERVRMEVPGALVRLAGRRSLSLLGLLATDDRWRVRATVAASLADVADADAASLLVDMLEREDGRVREDVLESLEALTGRRYGTSVEAWRRWLASVPPDRIGRPGVRADDGADRRTSVASYYGIHTLSRRFLFVTDLSTSMDQTLRPRYLADDRDAPRPTRLERTQEELRRLVDDLDPEVQFDLAVFADDVESWRGRLVEASDRNRRAALSELDRWHARGGTNLFAALEHAFKLAEASLDDRRADPAPDTVFLLSDGEPSVGLLRDPDLLLELVAERNRVLRLRIHCVGLTREPKARDFLVRLARRTGGQVVFPVD